MHCLVHCQPQPCGGDNKCRKHRNDRREFGLHAFMHSIVDHGLRFSHCQCCCRDRSDKISLQRDSYCSDNFTSLKYDLFLIVIITVISAKLIQDQRSKRQPSLSHSKVRTHKSKGPCIWSKVALGKRVIKLKMPRRPSSLTIILVLVNNYHKPKERKKKAPSCCYPIPS